MSTNQNDHAERLERLRRALRPTPSPSDVAAARRLLNERTAVQPEQMSKGGSSGTTAEAARKSMPRGISAPIHPRWEALMNGSPRAETLAKSGVGEVPLGVEQVRDKLGALRQVMLLAREGGVAIEELGNGSFTDPQAVSLVRHSGDHLVRFTRAVTEAEAALDSLDPLLVALHSRLWR